MKQNNGYKDSPLGIIPIEWKVKKLGEVCQNITDGTHDTPQKTISGVPFITAIHVKDGNIDFKNCYYVDIETHKEIYRRCNPEYGDVLMVNIGAGIGASSLVKVNYEFSLKNVALLKPSKEIIGAYLEAYQLFNKHRLVNTLSNGGAQPFYGLEDIGNIRILLPPLPEQQKIAEILSIWDEAIEKQTQIIAQLETRKRGLMQQLLTAKKRLKGFEREWREMKIGDIGEISSAGVDKKVIEGETPIRLVNFLDVYRRDFIYSNELTHWVTANDDKITKCNIKKGDIFFTPSSEVSDDIGLSAVVMEDIPDAVYSYHIVRLRLFENWDLKYRAYAFKTDEFYKQADTLCDGSGQRYVISQSNFREMTIKVPSIKEQAAIADILFSADKEIDLAKKKLAGLKEQKKGLMQVLLTGKKRVKI
jgi:type I restriction enzyme S subunit